MSLKIAGTKNNQIFYFEGESAIRNFRTDLPKSSGKKKRQIYDFSKNNRRKYGAENFK